MQVFNKIVLLFRINLNYYFIRNIESNILSLFIINHLNIYIMNKENIKGYVIYEGKSQINGDNIVAIVTMNSNNIKTGNMASMWIMNADIPPTQASKEGKDISVCGDCKHRASLNGACYVILHHAPLQVYKSYKKGSYPTVTNLNVFEGIKMRFGAYGDPSAIPTQILVSIKAVVKNNTSYTHQWKQGNEMLKKFSMASVDSIEEQKQAVSEGWRTFRVTDNLNDIQSNEIICPNTTKNIKCIDCGLCSGNNVKGKNIVIEIHGYKKTKFNKKDLAVTL